ncbi:MAG TPA: hypothetical protein VK711_02620 [Puia sp.]|nr:hypothetical protein [Puia sp.]
MLPVPNISASCLISPNKIFLDGQIIFEHPGSAVTFLDKAYDHLEIAYPKFHKMDNLCKLGFLAAEILLNGRSHEKKYSDSETGLVLSNSHASLDVDLKYSKTIHSGASPALFVYTLPNIVIGEISIRHHFKGENAFFVFKHFDGKFMAEYVSGLFENKLVKSCFCGWVDILKEDYRAILFLVEKGDGENKLPFNADNLNKLNRLDHG